MSAVDVLLLDGGVRLLAQSGPGGVGKTRLVVGVAPAKGSALASSVAFAPVAAIYHQDGLLAVITDVNGNASFAFTPDPPIPAGRAVTATATNQGGSTSEFSPAVTIPAG
jgi:hypothetical protein